MRTKLSFQPLVLIPAISVVVLLLVLFVPVRGYTALLGDAYVNSVSPLFAEIPVCLDISGEQADDFSIEIVGNEVFNDEGEQPFISQLTSSLDQLSDADAIMAITSEVPSPDDLQLIVTLLDADGEQVDSKQYNSFDAVKQTPDSFGCEQYVQAEEVEVVDSPQFQQADATFVIDVVDRDTWRNIAIFLNAAWFSNSFGTEQVMAALYQINLSRNPSISVEGSQYALPDQLAIPSKAAVAKINANAANALAQLLDGNGTFRVERMEQQQKQTQQQLQRSNQEVAMLRDELQTLRNQLELLTSQLTDSNELLSIRDNEMRKIYSDLAGKRKRIAELEAINLGSQQQNIVYYLKKATSSLWIWMVLGGLVVFLVCLLLISSHQRRAEYVRMMQIMNRSGYSNNGAINNPFPAKKKVKKSSKPANQSPSHNPPQQSAQIGNLNRQAPVVAKPPANIPRIVDEIAGDDMSVFQGRHESESIPTLDDDYSREPAAQSFGGDQSIEFDDVTNEQLSQLDLAHAYINMGDESEARNLLESLITSDEAEIRNRAEELLRKLG